MLAVYFKEHADKPIGFTFEAEFGPKPNSQLYHGYRTVYKWRVVGFGKFPKYTWSMKSCKDVASYVDAAKCEAIDEKRIPQIWVMGAEKNEDVPGDWPWKSEIDKEIREGLDVSSSKMHNG